MTDEDRRFVLDNINKRLRLAAPAHGGRRHRRALRRPPAGGGRAGERAARAADWLQLSRKHVVEVDARRAHISIFGGKLTDCLNVGEEVAAHVRALGVALPYPEARWYGEPPDEHARASSCTRRGSWTSTA